MNPLTTVVIPLQKTVTFSFEIDGKKVDADSSVFIDTTVIEPELKKQGAVLNKGSFKAPSTPGMYSKEHAYFVPGITLPKTEEKTKHPTAIGLFFLRFESKAGKYGNGGKALTCRLLFNGTPVENDASLLPDKGPYEHVPGFKYDPSKPDRYLVVSEWLLKDQTPAGKLAYTPIMASPAKGEVTFNTPPIPPPATPGGPKPTVEEPTFSISVKVLVQLQIPWPKDYPRFLDDQPNDIKWKSDNNGSLALGNFYALFPLLPEVFRKDVKDVPIRRRGLVGEGGHMNQYAWEIIIDDKEIQHSRPQSISHHFVHEMTHTSNFSRTCAAWGQIIPGVATFLLEIGSLTAAAAAGAMIVAGVSTAGWIFVVIVVAIELISGFVATKKDFISEWSAVTAWQCNNFGWHAIPIIGHFIGSLFKTEPNMLFGFPSRKLCSGMAAYFGLENRELIGSGNWREAGFVSDYATSNPIEDLADSFASLALTETMLRMARGVTELDITPAPVPPPTPPVPPPVTPPPVPGKPTVMNRLKTKGNREKFLKDVYYPGKNVNEIDHFISVQYEEVDFDISGIQPKAMSAKSTANTSSTDFLKLMSVVQQMQAEWDNGPGPLFERNKEIMTKLAVPVRQNPTPLELIRTLELHGNGWQQYEGKEQAVEKGDMVADATQQPWMISVTDEQKRLQQVSGGFTYKKGMKAEDLIKQHSFFKLTWRPSAEKRNWLPNGEVASEHYKDLDAVFTHMVRLWGENKAPESGRSLSSFKGFLQEWMEKAGTWDAAYPFTANAELREVLNYLESHGQGLQVFDPGKITAAPGDLLIPYHSSSFALITRVSKETQCVDLLESGTNDKGPLGEAIGTARMRYNVPMSEFQYYWQPSPQLRKLI